MEPIHPVGYSHPFIGASMQTTDNSPFSSASPQPDDFVENQLRIPLIEEQLQVGSQVVETGRVKLTKIVHQAPETVTIPLTREEYTIEHVPVNQYVDQPPAPRQQGDTMIYPVLKEVLVVQKRLMLIEEIYVTKHHTQHNETQTVLLRREEVTVERIPAPPERPV
ncbi:YsnF/AvaK domain-containing protein [Spirosoma spitsbergense]|uniref:YsnF/AvaK domain-containing protein n=1 Tax=Spirosoma spitsbergense TaxID=431554 RepID=UPI0003A19684|nr:YsnF/AvaK domain-containing protein [Spirosoma spitsbergense]